MLLPGEYVIQFTADGYRSASHSIVVGPDAPSLLDVELEPLNSSSNGGVNSPSGGAVSSSSGGGAASSSGGGGGCFIDTLMGGSFMQR
jgi:hypothetical protein